MLISSAGRPGAGVAIKCVTDLIEDFRGIGPVMGL